jgi:hypothetical protein
MGLQDMPRIVFFKKDATMPQETFHYYCHVLKKMNLTCTAGAESFNTHDDGRVKTNRTYQKHKPLSLQDLLSTDCHLIGVPCMKSQS